MSDLVHLALGATLQIVPQVARKPSSISEGSYPLRAPSVAEKCLALENTVCEMNTKPTWLISMVADSETIEAKNEILIVSWP